MALSWRGRGPTPWPSLRSSRDPARALPRAEWKTGSWLCAPLDALSWCVPGGLAWGRAPTAPSQRCRKAGGCGDRKNAQDSCREGRGGNDKARCGITEKLLRKTNREGSARASTEAESLATSPATHEDAGAVGGGRVRRPEVRRPEVPPHSAARRSAHRRRRRQRGCEREDAAGRAARGRLGAVVAAGGPDGGGARAHQHGHRRRGRVGPHRLPVLHRPVLPLGRVLSPGAAAQRVGYGGAAWRGARGRPRRASPGSRRSPEGGRSGGGRMGPRSRLPPWKPAPSESGAPGRWASPTSLSECSDSLRATVRRN